MSKFIFILLLVIAQLIRGPLSFLMILLKNVFPGLKKRIEFERKNSLEEECRSFKKDGLMASYCFEVSSEGELEQVRPLIETFLKEKKRLEILFASPSVESKCLSLARDNPDLLRVFRVPLATHFFLFQTAHGFISAKKLIFCRYDFFPELLILKFFGKKLILVNGAAGKKPSWFKSQVYKLFDVIVAANQSERNIFIEREGIQAKKVLSFDFRIPRIFERAKRAEAVLSSITPLQSYFQFLRNRSKNSILILGSAWESDLIIFSSPEWAEAIGRGEIHLLVAPHDLGQNSLKSLRTQLESLFPKVPVCEISASVNEFNPECSGIVFLNWRGILCELYTLSELVYIGGGFGRSIHSVLEPFLSGAKVFCGPRIHRSSEYDFITEAKAAEIQLLKNGDSFYTLFKEKAATPPDHNLRLDLGRTSADVMKAVLTEIEQC